jgi:hypothetical protein
MKQTLMNRRRDTMKKTLVIVGIVALVLGGAAWSYAHGPGYGYGPGPGYYHMGPGMMGPGMMGPGMMGRGWGSGYGPCWQAAQGTPEQQQLSEEQRQQYEEQTKNSMEQYIQRVLPGYKLEKKGAE